VATVGLIITYTLILGGVAYFVYLAQYGLLVLQNATSSAVGRSISTAAFIAQMIMALMLSLSLNASTIATEKDQETFDLLNLTLFKSFEIVLGKFMSSTGFLFILVFTALPIYTLAFTFGGVQLAALWRLAVVVAGMTLFISSIGILLSLISEDLRSALGRSFLAMIIIGAVTGVMGGALVGSFDTTPPNPVTYWLGTISLLLNPLWSAMDIIGSPFAAQLQWPTPQPAFVPMLLKNLWLWSAAAQLLCTAILLFVTTKLYPRYRASKSGGVA